MTEFSSQALQAVIHRLDRHGHEAMRRTVAAVAAAGEKQAKINASNGSHPRGTKTPASKGQGPAVITGNLRRNITHEPVRQIGTVFESRIGVAGGAGYGKYVEGLGYVFMKPAAEFLRQVVIPQIARTEFGRARLR